MRSTDLYNFLLESKKQQRKCLAILIDPDKFDSTALISLANDVGCVDFIFVGGSLVSGGAWDECVKMIKRHTQIPVVLFPGSVMQISNAADGILLLSLLSGRNADYLIGNHVIAAPYLAQSNLEIIPTGYLLIDSGVPTTASYMSNSTPIPYNKPDIARCTALAGEQLGLKLIYLDTGSGAAKTVSTEMVKQVKQSLSIPLIVGGGIRTVQEAQAIFEAGADLIVVGNACEKDPEFLTSLSKLNFVA